MKLRVDVTPGDFLLLDRLRPEGPPGVRHERSDGGWRNPSSAETRRLLRTWSVRGPLCCVALPGRFVVSKRVLGSCPTLPRPRRERGGTCLI